MYRFQEVMKTMGATAAGSTGGLGQFQQSKPQYIPGIYSYRFLTLEYTLYSGTNVSKPYVY